jgi:hypothetical protein
MLLRAPLQYQLPNAFMHVPGVIVHHCEPVCPVGHMNSPVEH